MSFKTGLLAFADRIEESGGGPMYVDHLAAHNIRKLVGENSDLLYALEQMVSCYGDETHRTAVLFAKAVLAEIKKESTCG